jgi:aminoglycoside phosphotransferase (APT) family kinase protein
VARQLRRLHDHASPEGLPMFGGGATWQGQIRWLAGWASQWCRQRHLLTSAVLDRLEALMGTAFALDDEPAICLLHGDCGPYHWLLSEGTVAAVVDFGDTGRGDPVWDLAVLTLWDRQHLPSVLDGYRADAALRRRVEALHLPYTVLRHLLAISWLVEHGIDPTPTVTELNRLAS